MATEPRLSILVFGAGAIGTYFGGSLALAGNRVVFVEQPRVAQELNARGLKLDLSVDPDRPGQKVFQLKPAQFRCEISLEAALAHGSFDVALFALKSFDTASALEGMRPYWDVLPPVLCLQNGVDNEPAIATALGAERVIPGTVTSAIGKPGVGEIVLEKLRGVGIAAGHPLSGRLEKAFNEARLNAKLYPRAGDLKWSKMLTNLISNASSAILDMDAGQVFSHPGMFQVEMHMLREALAVMAAQGIRVVDLPGTPVRALAFATRLPGFIARPVLVRAVGGGRGGKMPSFHIDLHSGRGKSEVDYLNGAVVRAGAKAGIPTPVNRFLNETLLALTEGTLPLGEFARQPDKLLARIRSV